jgi:hypothetical protein
MTRIGRFERSEDGTTWETIDFKTMRDRLGNDFRAAEMVVKTTTDRPMTRVHVYCASYRFNPAA